MTQAGQARTVHCRAGTHGRHTSRAHSRHNAHVHAQDTPAQYTQTRGPWHTQKRGTPHVQKDRQSNRRKGKNKRAICSYHTQFVYPSDRDSDRAVQ